MIVYQKYHPTGLLRSYIHYYYYLEHTGIAENATVQRITPDGTIELNFNLAQPVKRKESSNAELILHGSYMVSKLSRHYFIQRTGNVKIFGACFYPWGLVPFVQHSMSELKDQVIDLSYILGSDLTALEDSLYHVIAPEKMVALFEQFICQCFYRSCQDDQLVVHCARNIIRKKGNVDIGSLTDAYGLSQRRLEQRFVRMIGTNLKLFARLQRFRGTFQNLNKNASLLTRQALDMGYYDQSHFIHDFNYFSGISPGRYSRERHPLNDLLVATE